MCDSSNPVFLNTYLTWYLKFMWSPNIWLINRWVVPIRTENSIVRCIFQCYWDQEKYEQYNYCGRVFLYFEYSQKLKKNIFNFSWTIKNLKIKSIFADRNTNPPSTGEISLQCTQNKFLSSKEFTCSLEQSKIWKPNWSSKAEKRILHQHLSLQCTRNKFLSSFSIAWIIENQLFI